MQGFLKTNLITGLKTLPDQKIMLSIMIFCLFAALALSIGFASKILEFKLLDTNLIYILPFVLFVFPSMFEEILFRGLLIPNDTYLTRTSVVFKRSVISATLFTLWHPLNALTINVGAQHFFLDPWFLLIVFILGMSCSLGYIFSRSLWVPIIMHWFTVLVWVLFLGGRNLVLQT